MAWMVAFALLFQMVLPILAAEARADDPLNVLGVICTDHVAQPDSGRSVPNDKTLNDCCTVCALLHAAQLAMPAGAISVPVMWPTPSRPLDRDRDDLPTNASAPVPYSSRAPPLAA